MPNHYSALKRMRQTKRRTAVNRQNKGVLRASLRQMRQAVTSAAPEKVQQVLPKTVSRIDKAVQKGLIHKNTAARLKSRLMRRVQASSTPSAK